MIPLPLHTVSMIRELRSQGWSFRKIARRLAVSLSSVVRVLQDEWQPPEISDDPFAEQKLLAERCEGCGGLVYEWPCRLCEMRDLVARAKTPSLRAA